MATAAVAGQSRMRRGAQHPSMLDVSDVDLNGAAPPDQDPIPDTRQADADAEAQAAAAKGNKPEPDHDLFDANDPVLSRIKAKLPDQAGDGDGDGDDEPAPKRGPGRPSFADKLAQLQEELAIERAGRAADRTEAQRTFEQRLQEHKTTHSGEVQSFQAQLDALQDELLNSRVKATELDVDKLVDIEALANAENLNPEAARELANKMLKPMAKKLTERSDAAIAAVNRYNQSAFDKYKTETDEKFAARDEREAKAQRRAVNRDIRRAHKDFDEIKDRQDFKEFRHRRIPGTSIEFGSQLVDSYEDGDVDRVIELIDIYKAGRPRVEDEADIDMTTDKATSTATTARQPANGGHQLPEFTYDDPAQWRYEMQRGEIDRATFRKRMVLFEQSERAGLVVGKSAS